MNRAAGVTLVELARKNPNWIAGAPIPKFGFWTPAASASNDVAVRPVCELGAQVANATGFRNAGP